MICQNCIFLRASGYPTDPIFHHVGHTSDALQGYADAWRQTLSEGAGACSVCLPACLAVCPSVSLSLSLSLSLDVRVSPKRGSLITLGFFGLDSVTRLPLSFRGRMGIIGGNSHVGVSQEYGSSCQGSLFFLGLY